MLPTNIAKNLRSRYIAGLSIIALLITSSCIMMQWVISEQENYSSVISLAGHQAGLVSRIAYFSSLMAISDSGTEFDMARAQVGRTINKLKSAHKTLRNGSKELDIPVVTNDNLRDIYDNPMGGLEIALQRFVERVEIVYNSSSAELSVNSQAYIFITTYGLTRWNLC